MTHLGLASHPPLALLLRFHDDHLQDCGATAVPVPCWAASSQVDMTQNLQRSLSAAWLQVDAALDLSHTQNIGRMIKAHFPQSQFIVVSLKEGMFNNANVLFRTKFVDGVSTVTRTATRRRAAGIHHRPCGPTGRTLQAGHQSHKNRSTSNQTNEQLRNCCCAEQRCAAAGSIRSKKNGMSS